MEPISLGIAGVSALSSIWGMSNEDKAQYRQEKLQERALQLSETEYNQALQRQQEWSEKYGSIERNMLDYVQHLDTAKLQNQTDATVSRQFESARKNMDSHLADRGFDVAGGVHADMFQRLASDEAKTKLAYNNQIEQQVLQTQQSVLNGHPQPNDPSTANIQNNLSNIGQAGVVNAQRTTQNLDNITTEIGGMDKAIEKYYNNRKTNNSTSTTAKEA